VAALFEEKGLKILEAEMDGGTDNILIKPDADLHYEEFEVVTI
jgi:hypothetical protein